MERPDTPTLPRATLANLPTELLQEVVTYLDNDALLQLGLTCKDTHFIALSTFFKRNDIREPNDGWLVAYKTPPQTLTAIHAAQWVRNLRQIHYYLNTGLDRLLADVRELNRLVERLPKVELVKLHFSVVDTWASGYDDSTLDRDEWFTEFTSLLDIIIERRCTELHITGGGQLKKLYQHVEPSGLPTLIPLAHSSQSGVKEPTIAGRSMPDVSDAKPNYATMSQGAVALPVKSGIISRIFRKGSPPGSQDRKPMRAGRLLSLSTNFILNPFRRLLGYNLATNPPLSSPTRVEETVTSRTPSTTQLGIIVQPTPPEEPDGLKELYIHSDMLLQYTFFPWTILIIHKAAKTLTHLSFRWSDTTTITWTTLLASLDLPLLETFEITTDLVVCRDSASFHDLTDLFRRHPTIRKIVLQGVERPFSPPVITDRILPHLTSVLAHPIWISSLVRMVRMDPQALPNLNSIGISTEYYQHGTFDHSFIDAALVELASLNRIGIELTLRFMCQNGVAEWLTTHVNFGKEESIITLLFCVFSLVISSSFFVTFRPHTAQLFPQWLSLFPCLGTVKLIEMPEEQYGLFNNAEFLGDLVKLCPNIKSMEVGRTICDLEVAKATEDKIDADSSNTSVASGKDNSD